ncbi:MAG: hypothetical protein PWQ06_1245 [Anaerophaga sp.]|nr:hypothetical protein [Anaerophaga sp.]
MKKQEENFQQSLRLKIAIEALKEMKSLGRVSQVF